MSGPDSYDRLKAQKDRIVARKQNAIREALEPVLHWFQSDEQPERPLAEIVADVVAELQADRATVLQMNKLIAAADRLSTYAQTTSGTAGGDDGLVEAIDTYAKARANFTRAVQS